MPIFKRLNQSFFQSWSPEMAYVLGFFAADGSMIINQRGAHYLDFHITDKDLLFKIRKAFGSDHKIKKRKQNKKWHASYHLQIGSKQMFHDLKKLGLTPRKSKTLQLPKIPRKYFADFVRGYFDGDGHVTVCTYIRKNRNNKKYTVLHSGFTSGSKLFLKQLQKNLNIFAELKGGSLTFLGKAYRLRYSIKNSLKLYNFMYNSTNNDLSLERKQKIFQKYIRSGSVVG